MVQAIKHHTKQIWECWSSFNFSLDKLVFHPQIAEDCGWKASCEGSYEVSTGTMLINLHMYLIKSKSRR